MHKIEHIWRNLIGGMAILLALAACGGGGGNAGGVTPAPMDTASVAGKVADLQTGEALAGVTVKIGTLNTTTDPKGKFSLADVPVGSNVVVQFSKSEYAANFATVDVIQGQTSVADRKLARVAIRKALDANTGGTVTLDASPAMVQLPPGALVNVATGAAAGGTVSVEMTPIDPSIAPLNMPGNFRAQGEAMPIESMGALQVELRDASGARLNLAAGKSATIRIPVPSGAKSPPLTMPLYYFNETTGLWVREGSAGLAGLPPNQYYEGQVSHFTYWNADMPADSIMINGCVVNEAGQPVSATILSSGIDYQGTASAQTTMPGGLFKVWARRNSLVEVSAQDANRAFASVKVATGSTDLTLPNCLVVKQQPPVIHVQPAGITLTPGSDYGVLSVSASGADKYQWYRNGQPIAGNSPLLSIFASGDAAGDYYVVVSNEFGSVTSEHAQVVVSAPTAPAIVVQPLPSTVLEGGQASFTVWAEGFGLRYQWLRNGVEIVGANSATLTLNSLALGDSGAQFSCRVSNNVGTVLSNAALLTVGAKMPPSIAQQPGNVSIRAGQSASFSVVASGTPPFTYQWLLNGVAIPNATAATYQTPPTVVADSGGLYSVKVSNAQGTVTSSPASVTVTSASGASGLYLPFMTGQQVGDSFGWGGVPQSGGTPVSLVPAAQGTDADIFPELTFSNGLMSDYRMRNLVFWQNQRLYRQDLLATAGVAAPVQVSNLTAAGLCDPASGSSREGTALGFDFADASKSWRIYRKPGADGACNTNDDTFAAVRMNMAASESPVSLSQLPLAVTRDTNGTLTGWLVRQDQQVMRVQPDFSNPVPFFTLPATDLSFASSGEPVLPGILIFTSGRKLYAVQASQPGQSTPVQVADLGTDSISTTVALDAQNVIIALANLNSTRLVQLSSANLSSKALASFPGWASQLVVTPTRIVASDRTGKLLSMPRTGGQPQTVFTPGGFGLSLLFQYGGERFWQQSGDSVISVNSDGSALQTLAGSQLAGCIYKQAVTVTDMGCDAILVLQGTSLQAYDAATGSLRLTYGTIPAPAAPLLGFVRVANYSKWGQGAIMTQTISNPTVAAPGTAISYYITTDRSGVTRLNLP